MPQVIPLIPLIIAGVGTGVSAFEAFNQPGAPKAQPTAPTDTASQDAQTKAALLSAAPSVQERLGGSVAPDFFSEEIARMTGNLNDLSAAQQVAQQYMGLGGVPGKTGVTNAFEGEGGGQSFNNPFGVGKGSTPNFFEGLLGEGSGGDATGAFSGGFS